MVVDDVGCFDDRDIKFSREPFCQLVHCQAVICKVIDETNDTAIGAPRELGYVIIELFLELCCKEISVVLLSNTLIQHLRHTTSPVTFRLRSGGDNLRIDLRFFCVIDLVDLGNRFLNLRFPLLLFEFLKRTFTWVYG